MSAPTKVVIAISVLVVSGCALVGGLWWQLREKELPRGRTELAALKKEAVVRIRAPGTDLRTQREHAATTQWGFKGAEVTGTVLEQVFSMAGEPAEAVGFYRGPAEAAGWKLLFQGCSRAEQATALSFTKTIGSYEAGLTVRAQLATSPRAARPARQLSVTLGPISGRPVDAGTRRNDLRCLAGLDPSDPRLALPRVQFTPSEQLCNWLGNTQEFGLSVTERMPDETSWSPDSPSRCYYLGGPGIGALFTLEEASEPFVYYEDRAEGAVEPDDVFLFTESGEGYSRIGVWVMSANGPYVLKSYVGSRPGEYLVTSDQLLAMGRRIASSRHAPVTPLVP